MKKVLIITYYWPPAGGAGVQRWLKFVKYLQEFGWEPVVYTPSNGELPVEDTSLLKDVPENITIIKRPIWEPYSIYKLFIGQRKHEKINAGFLTERKKPKLTEKIAVWIRGNFFIPDARKFWIKPSIRFLANYLRKNPVDAIISTGPPHSMHLIALGIKSQMNLPWLADFRDPWTNIDFYPDLMLTDASDKKHHRLEMEVLKNADVVLSIGTGMANEFIEILEKKGLSGTKCQVLTNGYDEEDVYKGELKRDTKFSIAHIGSMVRTRNPLALWSALSSLTKKHNDFAHDLEIRLIGKVDVNVLQSLEEYGLTPYLNKIDYLSHSEIVKQQQLSQVLLLVVNNTGNSKGILTGKFFEYLSARRPILCIGPADGEVAQILRETKAGKISGYDEIAKMEQHVWEYYQLFKKGELEINSTGIEKYSRRELASQLCTILNKMTKKQSQV